MRTTLNLDDGLIRELMDATQAKTKTAAITQAASELVRRKKLEKLKSLSGKIHLSVDRAKRERVELLRQRKLTRPRHGHR